MEVNDLVKGTMKAFNCCDRKAMSIIAKYMNTGEEQKLIEIIEEVETCKEQS